MNFWRTLQKPIIGLSPMDGVTDAAFRAIIDTYGKPDVCFTEFVSVEALKAGAIKELDALRRKPTPTPTVAQFYGRDLEGFVIATIIACELGFEGIDINMGCPAKSVAARGAGAGLIRDPAHALAIVETVHTTIEQWADGVCGLHNIPETLYEAISNMKTPHNTQRYRPPLSVKTRIGYEKVITEEWVGHIVSPHLSALTVHGRTLKQGYAGISNWAEIQKAAQTAREKNAHIVVLGSGDIASRHQGEMACKDKCLDGVLIGRGALGNPWVFTDKTPTTKEKLRVAKEHAHLFAEMFPHKRFLTMRKHLPWYTEGFAHAAQARLALSTVNSLEDVDRVIDKLLADPTIT